MSTEITKDSLKADIFKAYQKSYGETIELKAELKKLKDAPVLITPNALGILQTDKAKFQKESEMLSRLFPASKGISVCDITDEMVDEWLSPLLPREPVTVVIPYIKAFAQANELQLALRGWDKHFKHEMNVVIIGDREPWMNNMVGVIECDRIGNNPPLDVVNKMQLAIDSDLVSEKFIWANDDQYLNTPCILADFETLKGVGHLGNKFGASTYQQNKKRTAELLAELELGDWDFSSHTPIVYEKEKLAELIEKFELKENAYLVQSLYFNYFYPDFVPYNVDAKGALLNDNIKAGVYRVGADLGLLQQLIPQKKLLSNSESGWSEALQKILEKRLPEKCRFEQ